MEIDLGAYKVKSAQDAPKRLAQLIWGDAGGGKSTLAATAPGRKLWILFDDSGLDSITGLKKQLALTHPAYKGALSEDILVLDLSAEKNNIIDKFKQDDPFGLSKILADDSIGIDTVVVDSLTRVAQMALEHMISLGLHKSARLELPGKGSFGGRNALLLRLVVTLMNVTAKYNKNIVFIAHEGAPSQNDEGVITGVSMSVGGQLPQQLTQKLGEVWYLRDSARNGRELYLRPFQYYKPMKSRIFNLAADKPASFKWKYDIEKPDPNFEIATFYQRWKDGDYAKLAVPV